MKITINTTGTANQMPTMIHLNFKFTAKDKIQDYVINLGSKQILDFKEILKKLNISEETMETTAYHLKEKTKKIEKSKGIVNKESATEYVFDHYELTQTISLEIPYDLELFSRLIAEKEKSNDTSTYDFSFTLTKEEFEILEAEAISNAIINATKKAEIIRDNLKKENLECVSMTYQEYQNYRYARSAVNFEKAAIEQQGVNTKDLENSLYPQKIEKNVNLTVIFELN